MNMIKFLKQKIKEHPLDEFAYRKVCRQLCHVISARKITDVEGLKKAIRQIKKERKSSYSEKCRKHAQMYYQKDNNYQKYIELYRKLKKK